MPPSSADIARILNFTADLFESSAQRMFTREDIVTMLRKLPDEMSRTLLERELERAVTRPTVRPS